MSADRPPLNAEQLADAVTVLRSFGMLPEQPTATDSSDADNRLRRWWNKRIEKREERRARSATMDKRSIVLEQFDSWRLLWGRPARHALALGVTFVWSGLTMVLFFYICHSVGIWVPSWLPEPKITEELLAGMFVAWSAITTAAHQALRPSREKNDTTGTMVARIVDGIKDHMSSSTEYRLVRDEDLPF